MTADDLAWSEFLETASRMALDNAGAEGAPVLIGSSVWMADPNLPGIDLESIVGGLVIDSDIEDTSDGPVNRYATARNYQGRIVFSSVRADQVAVHTEHVDQALASNVYRALCREVGAQKRARESDLVKIRRALRACEIWSGLHG